MNLAAELIPIWLTGVASVALLCALGFALRDQPWKPLLDNELGPVWIAAIAGVTGLWSMSVGVRPGLELHMLGTTLLTLVFGWRLAILGATLALLGVTTLGLYEWQAVGLNGLLLAVLPVTLAFWLGRTVYQWLPRHLFIYVFAVAFFGSMGVIAAVVLLSAALFLLLGAYTAPELLRDYVAMLPLIAFPEGFVTGMIMTLLVVYRPDWVRTFNDRDYIDPR